MGARCCSNALRSSPSHPASRCSHRFDPQDSLISELEDPGSPSAIVLFAGDGDDRLNEINRHLQVASEVLQDVDTLAESFSNIADSNWVPGMLSSVVLKEVGHFTSAFSDLAQSLPFVGIAVKLVSTTISQVQKVRDNKAQVFRLARDIKIVVRYFPQHVAALRAFTLPDADPERREEVKGALEQVVEVVAIYSGVIRKFAHKEGLARVGNLLSRFFCAGSHEDQLNELDKQKTSAILNLLNLVTAALARHMLSKDRDHHTTVAFTGQLPQDAERFLRNLGVGISSRVGVGLLAKQLTILAGELGLVIMDDMAPEFQNAKAEIRKRLCEDGQGEGETEGPIALVLMSFVGTQPSLEGTLRRLLRGEQAPRPPLIGQQVCLLAPLPADLLFSALKPMTDEVRADVDRRMGKYLPGSREWVFRAFREWAEDENPGSSRSLWLQGVAGMGKSVISAVLIDTFGRSVSDDEEEGEPQGQTRNFPRIIGQISVHYPAVGKKVIDDLRRPDSDVLTALQAVDSADATQVEFVFDQLVLLPLNAYLDNNLGGGGSGDAGTPLVGEVSHTPVIVLDALDELQAGSARSAMLKLLSTRIPKLHKKVKFFITSRPEPDIVKELEEKLKAEKLDQFDEKNKDDLRRYCTERFIPQNTSGGEIMEESALQALVDELVEKSAGLFLWFRYAEEALERSRKSASPTEPLSVTPQTLLMEGFYREQMERMERRIEGAFGEDRDGCQHVVALLLQVLAVICILRELPRMADLGRLAGLTENTAALVLNLLGLLFSTDSDKEPIRATHKSVFDFLLSPRETESLRWKVDIVQGHRTVCKVSRGAPSRVLGRSGRPLDRYSGPPSVEDILSCHPKTNTTCRHASAERTLGVPFIRYCLCHGLDHLTDLARLCSSEKGGDSDVLIDEVTQWTALLLERRVESNATSQVLRRHLAEREVEALAEQTKTDSIVSPVIVTPLFFRLLTAVGGLYERARPLGSTFVDLLAVFSALPPFPPGRIDDRRLSCSTASCSALPLTKSETIAKLPDTPASAFPSSANLRELAFQMRKLFLRFGASALERRNPLWFLSLLSNSPSQAFTFGVNPRTFSRITPTYFCLPPPLNFDPCVVEMRGHRESVRSVAFSPDGRTLATASDDRSVRLWDVGFGREVKTLEGHKDLVSCVTFSPDGKMVGTGSWDTTARVWDVESGGEVRKFVRHGDGGYVNAFAFSPDGKIAATDCRDNTIRLWEVETVKEMQQLAGHTQSVRCIAFSPNGKMLATCSKDQTIRLWDVAAGKEEKKLEGHSGCVYSIAFSPDGRTLVSGSRDSSVCLWDVYGGTVVRKLEGHQQAVTSVAFSPGGEVVATGSDDATVRVWDAVTGDELNKLQGHRGSVLCLTFSPDGNALATASWDKTVRLWDLAAHQLPATAEGHRGPVRSVAFSRDGRTLATASDDRSVRLWDVGFGREVKTLEGHKELVSCVTFSPNGKIVGTGSWDTTARVWDVESGGEVRKMEGHEGYVNAVAFSPDGKTLATCSRDNTTRLWQIETGNEIKVLQKLAGERWNVFSVAFSPDGNTLATGSDSTPVRLWDLLEGGVKTPDARSFATGSGDAAVQLWDVFGDRVRKLHGHRSFVHSVAFSLDGKLLASGSDDKTARLWDVETGEGVRELEGHGLSVRSVAFSPDGRLLATGSEDETARLWEVSTGKVLMNLEVHTSCVSSVAFSLMGTMLATGSSDDTARIWFLTGSLLYPSHGFQLPCGFLGGGRGELPQGFEWESVSFSSSGSRFYATSNLDEGPFPCHERRH
uniref:Uncharacterized protein n=1 Tax=Chromera velia CCMP2878 TaxID=1169474 RepID=A0A0G4GWN5_9ALVE|eukprot:Cvel_23698.t1-p1 / transcript=Cvel_23698.t1 / gene=Cvel_23698 / organism=Chromera_velia_CCMP2878 / gene_product=Uncharacterized WD repeat-containing protein, putative / transcript_product=Uncharacterized WD repeat-containing protein, putative / location=Cvel_scaffold2473:6948-13520(+) / protein_length=1781 / sequence_SO=supercontig / SO=protein_coding / is_pseudo=false